MDTAFDEAVKNTLQRFEATGSPVLSDGEQTKSSFATYIIDYPHKTIRTTFN